jgi:hypothetical protein
VLRVAQRYTKDIVPDDLLIEDEFMSRPTPPPRYSREIQ